MQDKSDQSLDILPNIVRTLPNTVRLSLPTNRSTRLSYQGTNERNFLPGYEYCNNNNQSRNTHFNRELTEEFWDRFKEYLKVTHREKSIICRLSYAKKYHHVLIGR